MPKSNKHQNRAATNQLAHRIAELSTIVEKLDRSARPIVASVSQYLADIGRKGGVIGGKRRLKTMTARERKKVASKAAKARWKKAKKSPQ